MASPPVILSLRGGTAVLAVMFLLIAGGCQSYAVFIDADNDGYPFDQDCNDEDPSVNPDAREIPYDAVDQNCNGSDMIEREKFLISNNDSNENVSDVAFGGGVFLVVWEEQQPGGTTDIYGQVISPDGSLVRARFPIRINPIEESSNCPKAAFGGTDFLVVWEHRLESLDWVSGGYGQRISVNGQLLGDIIPIADAGTVEDDVRISACGSQWLVTWIWRGSACENCRIVARPIGYDGSIGDMIIVDDGVDMPQDLVVAANTSGQLVAWSGGRTPIWARALYCDGRPRGDKLVISDRPNSGYPSHMASDGENYLLVFQSWEPSAINFLHVVGQIISADGSPLFTSTKDNIVISWRSGSQTRATVSRLGSSYLVFWRDRESVWRDIYAQEVSFSGDLLFTDAFTNYPILADQSIFNHMASASSGDRILLTWSYSETGVFGLFWPP